MKKWMGLVLASAAVLVGVGTVAAGAGLGLAHLKMNRQVTVDARPVPFVTDEASRTRGRYLFVSRGCADCHGADGRGRVFLDTPDGLYVRGANITTGANSAVFGYRPDDWDRAIRHGVSPTGRPLLFMPSEDYNRLSDRDLTALVAYVRSLPPVAGARARVDLPMAATLAYAFGALSDAAAKIDHALPPAEPVPEGVTVEHGRYVVNMCLGCHGPELVGGRIPGAPPDWPPAPSLRPGTSGVMARYPDAQSFARMLETGRRPDGSPIGVMPFEALRALNATDVSALYLFLTSHHARPGTGP